MWPHLLAIEFASILSLTAFVTIFSALVKAPLLGLADVNQTPNPSKAPWYFLGLQELLKMFHPMVAGVTIPGIALGAARDHAVHRQEPVEQARPTASSRSSMMTMFLMMWAVLVIIGSFFRGRASTSSSPGTRASSSSCRSRASVAVAIVIIVILAGRRASRSSLLANRAPRRRPARCRARRAARDAVDDAAADDADASDVDRARGRPAASVPTRPRADARRRARAARAAARSSSTSRSTRKSSASPAGSSSTAACSPSVGFSARRLRRRDARLPVADRRRRLRRQGQRRQARRHPRRTSTTNAAAVLRRRRRARTSCQYPKDDAARRPKKVYKPDRSTPAWSRASSRSTSGACTSAAASRCARRRSGSSARATARSTTGSARRRPARRRAVSTASRRPSPAATITIDTGDIDHRSADRHQHHRAEAEGPLCV